MFWLVIILIIAIIFFINNRRKYSRYNQLLDQIPGPKRSWIPLLGNTDMFFATKEPPPHAFITVMNRLAKEYQSVGLFRFDIGFEKTVCLFSPEAARDLLTDTQNITKSSGYDFIVPWLSKRSLIYSTGDVWRADRRHLSPSFHFKVLDEFLDPMNRHAVHMCDIISKNPFQKNSMKLLSATTLDTFCQVGLGLKTNIKSAPHESSYYKNLEMVSQDVMKRFISATLKYDWIWYLTPSGIKSLAYLKELHNFTLNAIEKRKEILLSQESPMKTEGNPKKRKLCLADLLITSHLEDPKTYSMEYIRGQLDTFIFAGHDTTSTTLASALFCISNHPDVQERLQQEISEVLGHDLSEIDSDKLKRMDYMEAVIKETLRYFPTVNTIGRTITNEVKIHGYSIPVDTTILVLINALHRDKNEFEDPEKFNPDRFLEKDRLNPFAFIPFSAGLRNCIGFRFAMQQMKIVLANILSRFNISSSLKIHEVKVGQAIVISFDKPIDITFSLRE